LAGDSAVRNISGVLAFLSRTFNVDSTFWVPLKRAEKFCDAKKDLDRPIAGRLGLTFSPATFLSSNGAVATGKRKYSVLELTGPGHRVSQILFSIMASRVPRRW
jgi:hypothetical protein